MRRLPVRYTPPSTVMHLPGSGSAGDISIIAALRCLEYDFNCLRANLQGIYSVGLKANCQYGRLPNIPLDERLGCVSDTLQCQPNVAIRDTNVSLKSMSAVVKVYL